MPLKQYLFTLISLVFISFFTFIAWQICRQADYQSLSISIFVILAFMFAVICGVISLGLAMRIENPDEPGIGYNFVGTLNMYVAIVRALFTYFDNNNHFSGVMLAFLLPLILGLFILEDIYFNYE